MLTMALGGLWHGAAWTFVIWGIVNGLAVLLHRKAVELRGGIAFTDRGPLHFTVGLVLTYWFCLASAIFFRAPDLSSALEVTRAFVFLRASGDSQFDPRWWLLFLLLALVHILSRHRPAAWRRMTPTTFGLAYGAAVATALFFVRTEAQPFFYFQF